MIIGHDWSRMSNIKTSSTEYDSVCMCELIRDLLDRFWSYCNRSAWESACWLNYGAVSYWLAMKLLTMIDVYLGMSNIKTSTGYDGAERTRTQRAGQKEHKQRWLHQRWKASHSDSPHRCFLHHRHCNVASLMSLVQQSLQKTLPWELSWMIRIGSSESSRFPPTVAVKFRQCKEQQ
jgi:hypothetical protein